MADKSFGVEQLDIFGTGTPTIQSPTDLNLNANTVAISTNFSVGGTAILNTVNIASGIVTAGSGVVTYFGDGENLIAGTWQVGNNGASNYIFTGFGGISNASNSTLYLARGQTYIFDMNASGHGFGIQTVSGSWSSGNEYTTGITNPRADTTPITFAVPFSAPSTLYYACTAGHSGMVGTINIYP